MLQTLTSNQSPGNVRSGLVSRQNILIATGVAVLLCGGIAVQGLMSHRWLPNAAVQNAALVMNDIPSEIGNWTSEDIALPDADQKIGGIVGYVQRTYRDRTTGTEVSLLLVAGESYESPSIRRQRVFPVEDSTSCDSQAFSPSLSPAKNHQQRRPRVQMFHKTMFSIRPTSPTTAIDDVSLIRVCWAWSTNGLWEAPANPRLQFASQPYLYKLYVSERWIPNGDVNQDAGAAQQFLMTALPVLRERLESGADGKPVSDR